MPQPAAKLATVRNTPVSEKAAPPKDSAYTGDDEAYATITMAPDHHEFKRHVPNQTELA